MPGDVHPEHYPILESLAVLRNLLSDYSAVGSITLRMWQCSSSPRTHASLELNPKTHIGEGTAIAGGTRPFNASQESLTSTPQETGPPQRLEG